MLQLFPILRLLSLPPCLVPNLVIWNLFVCLEFDRPFCCRPSVSYRRWKYFSEMAWVDIINLYKQRNSLNNLRAKWHEGDFVWRWIFLSALTTTGMARLWSTPLTYQSMECWCSFIQVSLLCTTEGNELTSGKFLFTFSFVVFKDTHDELLSKRKPFLFCETTDAAFDLVGSGQTHSCLHVLNYRDLPVWRQQLELSAFKVHEWFFSPQDWSAQLLLKKTLLSYLFPVHQKIVFTKFSWFWFSSDV